MPSIIPTDRQQMTFMNSLDDMVAPDHPVRLLDALIDRIVEQDPEYFNHLAPQGAVGRRGYAAAALIKLYMYGYIHGINSSRKLEAEAQRNIEVIWLLSGLTPCFKTIAAYRKDHPEQIRRVNEQIICFMADHGWIAGKRIGVDGTKLRAYTGWDMKDRGSLDKQLEKAHRQLEEWLTRLTVNDLEDELAEDTGADDHFGDSSKVMEEIDRLHQKIERLEALRQELDERGVTRISAADPDARLMKSARQGKFPAYNLQAAVDSAHNMIVVASATDEPSDFKLLEPMYWSSVHRLGGYPKEVLADTGYADLGDIQKIQDQTSTRCYIPENDTPKKNRTISFTYQPEADRFECSQGNPLVAVAKRMYHKTKDVYIDQYRGTQCTECPVASDCTRAKDGVRTLSVYHGAEWRHRYALQLASRYGRQRITERKELVEHVFGTLRYWMGQIPLKLRGLRKVQTEIDLYSSGYNIKRWMGLAPFNELMEEVTSWKPKPIPQPV